MNHMLNHVRGGLIVSCQALEDEPLHSSFIMSRMALAAEQAGAVGIRANTAADIAAIRRLVTLPIIGILKRVHADSNVYITPTVTEFDELLPAAPQMIATDATNRLRPHGLTLTEWVQHARSASPGTQLMADVDTVAAAVTAAELGFDTISTTLHGYTEQTRGNAFADDDLAFLREVLHAVDGLPVIAEGNVSTPEMARRALDLGAHAVVVGGAITRPQQIAARFTEAIAVDPVARRTLAGPDSMHHAIP